MASLSITAAYLNDAKKTGRLGNQLFVIAAVLGSAHSLNISPVFPNWDYAHDFEHSLPYDPAFNPTQWEVFKEPSFSYSPIPNGQNISLEGHFQSYRYFDQCEPLIRHYLTPKASIQASLSHRWFPIAQQKPTVSLHIRRGDYVTVSQFHPVIPLSYYRTCIETYFGPTYHYLVFSDDIPWCKAHFSNWPYTFTFVQDQRDIEDLFLMSMCSHHIIANSSFSWWGAWLNASPTKKVIAPNPWFGPKNQHLSTDDLLPPSWIQHAYTLPQKPSFASRALAFLGWNRGL